VVNIAALEPKVVWEHFQTLCDIPRPSKHEQALRDYLQGWAELRGLETVVDTVGNLIIRKPATSGMEDRVGVVLQGHLDMVCQANTGTVHDFFNDPIRPVLQDGWLIAENTTLGADNGIGVALGLAALTADDIAHGPLEVLLTLDEEAGMGGALGLEPGLLQGRMLINIDTEEWGEFYMGCAGGIDVNVRREYATEPLPAGYEVRQLTVAGLRGGHSGVDIHRGRGNANKLLVRLLKAAEPLGVRLGDLSGGTLRNAIPREARASLLVPAASVADFKALVDRYAGIYQSELAATEANLTVLLTAREKPAQLMSESLQSRLLDALMACPNGVMRMSDAIPGVTETSTNLGVIKTLEGEVYVQCLIRSLIDSGRENIEQMTRSLFTLAGASCEFTGAYPGWAPNVDSPVMALVRSSYQTLFGEMPNVMVIHAGLECGLFKSAYPEWDMVSFGPTIRGAHAPGEKVHIPAVERFWQLLVHVLEHIPAK